MVCTPRLLTAFGNVEALGQGIKALETELTGYVSLILGEDLGTELLLEILTDYSYDLAESGLDGIVDTIIHDGLSIGAQTIELLQAAITAAHTCCKQKKRWFHIALSISLL